ncbi:MAG: high-affinity branched-chain amino acid ABC transporter permease LivM [Rhodoferax sp.]|uniref:high-affinity branched-chain amino acid ABC transporter permease LivM n=1 Tax=Rhodoferax sp. TaxID=50421 RepID=UPI00262260A1|nr:high-affinity branched-chain amino acid ABC transporter permease LivM [Rhodoferax sp.]MDD5332598.1 high-affinity branched-chain amino acid ABC transporter permease LivM [Rhodoferax sp.]
MNSRHPSSQTVSAQASAKWRELLRDALFTFVLAWIVFGPITGLQLKGLDFIANWQRPLWLAVIVTMGRLLFLTALNTDWLKDRLQRSAIKTAQAATVQTAQEWKKWAIISAVAAAVAFALPFVFLNNSYVMKSLLLAMIYVLLGLGLNIVVGLAGLLDLGFVAFYAVGAYFLALGAQHWGLGFWGALVLSPLLAAALGGLLGFTVLRTHGDYLAIVTLGFGEIIRLVLTNWLAVTGGPNGLPVPAPTFFGLEFSRIAKFGGTPFHEFMGWEYNTNMKFLFLYVVLFLVLALMIFWVYRLRVMPMGRAWEALREDEIACRSLGINPVVVKLSAFMMGAMTGGLAGVFFASYQGFVNPTSFTFFESALILAIVVLGGLGSIVGVIVAAFVLTLLPEMLREFADFRILAFGILMVLMMIWRPRGLIRTRRPVFTIAER